jgi:[ribosomal protein S5]-alanine N-acetyltransferase
MMLKTSRLLFVHPSPELLEQRLLHEDSTAEVLGVGSVRIPPEFAADILFLLPSWAEQLRALTKEPSVPGGVLILQAEVLAVGTIGFKNTPAEAREVEIGYGINASHWGLGLASEAVQALITWAFETGYATRVTAKTAVNNPASMRVLEKNGFTKVGTDYDPEDGDLIVWALEK